MSGSLMPGADLAECREEAGWDRKVLLLKLGLVHQHSTVSGSLKGSLPLSTVQESPSIVVVLNLPNAVAF